MNLRNPMFLISVLGLSICHSAAQTSPETTAQTPVVRSESRLVVVDASVTDKKGNPISGIAQGAFHIFEDNKEQSIKNVSRESAVDSGSHIVLWFGKMSQSELIYVRTKALDFIREAASPKSVIALVNYLDESGNLKLTQNFTSDVSRLQQALATMKHTGANEQDARLDPDSTSVMLSPQQPSADGSPVTNQQLAANMRTYNDQTQGAENKSQVSGLSLLYAIRDLARTLGGVPGRKAIVMMAPQFRYKLRPDDFAPIAAACNKANVTVYFVDVRSDSSSVVDNNLDELIDATGGFKTDNPNDTLGALKRIASEQTERYVLTYSPAQSPEDSCHNLKVTVDQQGARVRARSAYCNAKPNDPLAGTPLDQALEARAKGATAGNLSATMQSAHFYTAPNSARVQVAAELSPDGLNFEKQNGRYRATVNVLGIAYKPDGEVGARFTDTIDLVFEDKDKLEQFKGHAYRYEKQFAVAPGNYDFKLVFSAGPDSFARVQTPLIIDPSDGKHMGLGGLVLSRDLRSAASSTNSIAQLADQVPLVSQGVRYMPSGSDKVQKTDNVGLYFELFEPGLQETSHPSALKFRILVLEKKNNAVAADSGSVGIDLTKWTNPVIPVGWNFAVDKLAPGTYHVEALAVDSAGTTVRRFMDFQLQ